MADKWTDKEKREYRQATGQLRQIMNEVKLERARKVAAQAYRLMPSARGGQVFRSKNYAAYVSNPDPIKNPTAYAAHIAAKPRFRDEPVWRTDYNTKDYVPLIENPTGAAAMMRPKLLGEKIADIYSMIKHAANQKAYIDPMTRLTHDWNDRPWVRLSDLADRQISWDMDMDIKGSLKRILANQKIGDMTNLKLARTMKNQPGSIHRPLYNAAQLEAMGVIRMMPDEPGDNSRRGRTYRMLNKVGNRQFWGSSLVPSVMINDPARALEIAEGFSDFSREISQGIKGEIGLMKSYQAEMLQVAQKAQHLADLQKAAELLTPEAREAKLRGFDDSFNSLVDQAHRAVAMANRTRFSVDLGIRNTTLGRAMEEYITLAGAAGVLPGRDLEVAQRIIGKYNAIGGERLLARVPAELIAYNDPGRLAQFAFGQAGNLAEDMRHEVLTSLGQVFDSAHGFFKEERIEYGRYVETTEKEYRRIYPQRQGYDPSWPSVPLHPDVIEGRIQMDMSFTSSGEIWRSQADRFIGYRETAMEEAFIHNRQIVEDTLGQTMAGRRAQLAQFRMALDVAAAKLGVPAIDIPGNRDEYLRLKRAGLIDKILQSGTGVPGLSTADIVGHQELDKAIAAGGGLRTLGRPSAPSEVARQAIGEVVTQAEVVGEMDGMKRSVIKPAAMGYIERNLEAWAGVKPGDLVRFSGDLSAYNVVQTNHDAHKVKVVAEALRASQARVTISIPDSNRLLNLIANTNDQALASVVKDTDPVVQHFLKRSWGIDPRTNRLIDLDSVTSQLLNQHNMSMEAMGERRYVAENAARIILSRLPLNARREAIDDVVQSVMLATLEAVPESTRIPTRGAGLAEFTETILAHYYQQSGNIAGGEHYAGTREGFGQKAARQMVGELLTVMRLNQIEPQSLEQVRNYLGGVFAALDANEGMVGQPKWSSAGYLNTVKNVGKADMDNIIRQMIQGREVGDLDIVRSLDEEIYNAKGDVAGTLHELIPDESEIDSGRGRYTLDNIEGRFNQIARATVRRKVRGKDGEVDYIEKPLSRKLKLNRMRKLYSSVVEDVGVHTPNAARTPAAAGIMSRNDRATVAGIVINAIRKNMSYDYYEALDAACQVVGYDNVAAAANPMELINTLSRKGVIDKRLNIENTRLLAQMMTSNEGWKEIFKFTDADGREFVPFITESGQLFARYPDRSVAITQTGRGTSKWVDMTATAPRIERRAVIREATRASFFEGYLKSINSSFDPLVRMKDGGWLNIDPATVFKNLEGFKAGVLGVVMDFETTGLLNQENMQALQMGWKEVSWENGRLVSGPAQGVLVRPTTATSERVKALTKAGVSLTEDDRWFLRNIAKFADPAWGSKGDLGDLYTAQKLLADVNAGMARLRREGISHTRLAEIIAGVTADKVIIGHNYASFDLAVSDNVRAQARAEIFGRSMVYAKKHGFSDRANNLAMVMAAGTDESMMLRVGARIEHWKGYLQRTAKTDKQRANGRRELSFWRNLSRRLQPTLVQDTPIIDTMIVSRYVKPGSGHSLESIINRYFPGDNEVSRMLAGAHGATVDVELTARAFEKMVGEYNQRPVSMRTWQSGDLMAVTTQQGRSDIKVGEYAFEGADGSTLSLRHLDTGNVINPEFDNPMAAQRWLIQNVKPMAEAGEYNRQLLIEDTNRSIRRAVSGGGLGWRNMGALSSRETAGWSAARSRVLEMQEALSGLSGAEKDRYVSGLSLADKALLQNQGLFSDIAERNMLNPREQTPRQVRRMASVSSAIYSPAGQAIGYGLEEIENLLGAHIISRSEAARMNAEVMQIARQVLGKTEAPWLTNVGSLIDDSGKSIGHILVDPSTESTAMRGLESMAQDIGTERFSAHTADEGSQRARAINEILIPSLRKAGYLEEGQYRLEDAATNIVAAREARRASWQPGMIEDWSRLAELSDNEAASLRAMIDQSIEGGLKEISDERIKAGHPINIGNYLVADINQMARDQIKGAYGDISGMRFNLGSMALADGLSPGDVSYSAYTPDTAGMTPHQLFREFQAQQALVDAKRAEMINLAQTTRGRPARERFKQLGQELYDLERQRGLYLGALYSMTEPQMAPEAAMNIPQASIARDLLGQTDLANPTDDTIISRMNTRGLYEQIAPGFEMRAQGAAGRRLGELSNEELEQYLLSPDEGRTGRERTLAWNYMQQNRSYTGVAINGQQVSAEALTDPSFMRHQREGMSFLREINESINARAEEVIQRDMAQGARSGMQGAAEGGFGGKGKYAALVAGGLMVAGWAISQFTNKDPLVPESLARSHGGQGPAQVKMPKTVHMEKEPMGGASIKIKSRRQDLGQDDMAAMAQQAVQDVVPGTQINVQLRDDTSKITTPYMQRTVNQFLRNGYVNPEEV